MTYDLIPGWPRLRERYVALWQQAVPGRRILAHIQNPNPARPPPEPWMLEASERTYLDPRRLLALKTWRQTAWNWHGDLFRYQIPSYGPNVFAGFCGARVSFGRETVWHEPVIAGLDEAERIHFDPANRYWRALLEATACFAEQCAGIQQMGVPDFGGPADWISCLMGTEAFLIAALEDADRMRAFALRLVREYLPAFDAAHRLATARNDGVVNWMPVWSDRRMGTVQDDIAVNVSPALYADVFLPAVREMAAHTEHTVLHWHDACAQHLDTLLGLDEIDVVQYGHDPNTGPFRNGLANMRKIQAAGKRLFISCVDAQDAEFFIRHLDPRGLMMIINTADDQASRRMEERVAAWTAARLAQGPAGPGR